MRPSCVLILDGALKILYEFPQLLPTLHNYACLFILISSDEKSCSPWAPEKNIGATRWVTVHQKPMANVLLVSAFYLVEQQVTGICWIFQQSRRTPFKGSGGNFDLTGCDTDNTSMSCLGSSSIAKTITVLLAEDSEGSLSKNNGR